MKDQSDPITPDEWLLRRVHKNEFRPTEPPSIDKYAFKPNVAGNYPDEYGISLFRLACIENVEQIFAKTPASKRERYGVVRVLVSRLLEFGLIPIRDDDDEKPIVLGHVVIPELNSINYIDDKDAILPLMDRLADHASEPGNVLMQPVLE